jgi:HPt (histidine-containing phosphotransfer) domain-containing protein
MDLPASMYVNYIARRKADHAKLTTAISAPGGIDDFKTVGHQIKGNASSFGFNDLVSIGEEMEKLNPAQLSSDGQRLLQDFWQWIVSTEKRLETELAGADEEEL